MKVQKSMSRTVEQFKLFKQVKKNFIVIINAIRINFSNFQFTSLIYCINGNKNKFAALPSESQLCLFLS